MRKWRKCLLYILYNFFIFLQSLLNFKTFVLQKPGEELTPETKDMQLVNVSSLPLTTQLAINEPFKLFRRDGTLVSEDVSYF